MSVSKNIIVKKCQEAGLSFWLASQVALEIDTLPETNKAITNKIAKVLSELSPDAAKQFDDYHSIKVRTSRNTLESFDRSFITRSLIKETRLPRITAMEIAQEIEDDIRRLQLKDISSPLIREMANVMLLDKRLTTYKTRYTRAGLPVYDISKIIEEQKQSPIEMTTGFGQAMLREYTLTRVLPFNIAQSHLNADLFIHNLDNFPTCPESIQNDLRPFLRHGVRIHGIPSTRPPKHAQVVAFHAARALLTSKQYLGKGAGFDFFNIFISPYLEKKSDKDIEQIAQVFLYELSNSQQNPDAFTINLDNEVPDFLKKEHAPVPGSKAPYSHYSEEARKFKDALVKAFIQGDYEAKPFNHPRICIKHRRIKKPETELQKGIYYLKQESNESMLAGNVLSGRETRSLRSGTMQSVSLNVLKHVLKSQDENALYDELARDMKAAVEIMRIKKDVMQDRLYKDKTLGFLTQAYDNEEYIRFNNFQNIISYYGLQETAEYYGDSKIIGRILRFSKKHLREFTKDTEINVQLGLVEDPECLSHFENSNRREGLNKSISTSIGNHEEMQQYFPAGKCLETSDKEMVNNKKINFLKII